MVKKNYTRDVTCFLLLLPLSQTVTPPRTPSSVTYSGGDLAPSLGGRKHFLNDTFFREKSPFSRPKFLMTFLSSTWIFIFCVVYCDKMSYTTLSPQEKPLFQKRIP